MTSSPAAPGAFWASSPGELTEALHCDARGLTDEEAGARRDSYGANRVGARGHRGPGRELARQFTQPIVLILIAATLLSLVLGDRVDAIIILVIVLLSGLLGFWQEHRASVTVARLLERVQVHVDVRRGGRVVPVDPEQLVPGDVLVLHAGDVVSADCRVLRGDALQVDESALTGETYPRAKTPDATPADAPLSGRTGALFQGSHVVSGQGEALVVVTGAGTELGRTSQSLAGAAPRTSFEAGSARFGVLLAQVTAVLTAAILVVNLALDRPVMEAVLFSLALAVGVTPQMLPAIISVSLSTGARRLAHAKVIVRRLNAIEDLGGMDLLCTDKTGTLTEGRLTLEHTVDAWGEHSDATAELAAVNAGLQTGFTNPLDAAVLAERRPGPQWQLVDEVPFDFERKRLSVLVDGPRGRLLVTKGAFAQVSQVCRTVATASGERPFAEVESSLEELFARLSADGFRIVAVAERALPDRTEATADDEVQLTLRGLLAFTDPPKAGLTRTVEDLRGLGIRLCMITGDNHLAARHVTAAIGIDAPRVLTGAEVDALDDAELASATTSVDAFAEMTPTQKQRVIQAARRAGSVVGYLGDGINDAAPLHQADVGISVDTAVDVAKSAAALVLLDKDLGVIVDGVRLGRQTFANTLKYVYTTVSANFGNTASMAIASAFLPFLPMLPRQILLLNFLSDLPSVTIAADRVDAEDVGRPQAWDLARLRRFMVVFGLLSSVFDLLTFAILLWVFDADETLFHTGWFVGSALTELAVLLVLRTRRVFFRSVPGRALVVSSVLVSVVVLALPYVPGLRAPLGLTPLSPGLLLALVATTATYVVAAELTKRVFYRRLSGPGPIVADRDRVTPEASASSP